MEVVSRPRRFASHTPPATPLVVHGEQRNDDEDPCARSPVRTAPGGFDHSRHGIPYGEVIAVDYASRTVGVQRRMMVYLPPGYSAAQEYPVLYLLHGLGCDEMGWLRAGAAGIILDNLYADRQLVPMLVVMPNGRASAEPPPANSFNEDALRVYGAFEEELLDEVIPQFESRFSVQADREHRALFGLSMGGGQALNFGLKNLDTFAWVGGFSPATNVRPPAELLPDPAEVTRRLRLLWLSCGDADRLMSTSRALHTFLEERQVPHVWHTGRGGHEWPVWRNDLYLAAPLLFRGNPTIRR